MYRLLKNTFIIASLTASFACEKKTSKQSSSGLAGIANQNGSTSLDQYNASTNPKVSEILKLKTLIESRRPKLERAKDIRGKLMLALMSNIGAGCMGEKKVDKIDITIDGQKINDIDVSALKQTAQYLPEATAGQSNFEFTLGDKANPPFLSFTNNEAQKPIFVANGRFTYQVQNANFQLKDLTMISIKKATPAYTKTDFCGSGKNAVKGCSMDATIKEVERYEMSSLTIKVNDILVYQNGNTHHIFTTNAGPETATQNMIWQDSSPQLNDSYLRAMQSTQCN